MNKKQTQKSEGRHSVSWFVTEHGISTSGGVGIGILGTTRWPEKLQKAKQGGGVKTTYFAQIERKIGMSQNIFFFIYPEIYTARQK